MCPERTRRGVETKLVLEGSDGVAPNPDTALIKAVVRSHRWFDDLVLRRARSLGEIAEKEGVSDRYVSHLMPLAFLATDIVEAILAGTQLVDLTAETLTKHTNLPLGWTEQKTLCDQSSCLASSSMISKPEYELTSPVRKETAIRGKC